MSSPAPAHFEHVALAVNVDDLPHWDRLLRRDLGGSASMGGEVPKIGFQGGQIDYPDGGMLEILSWLEGSEEKSAMKRYVDEHGGRAALHHLTFLVDDFEARVERSRALGYEPMLGRNSRNWKEFYVREPGLRPRGFLIQVLQADKDALQAGWTPDWPPFAAEYPDAADATAITGVRMATTDPDGSERLFVELLGAASNAHAEHRDLRWPGSSMRVRLLASDLASETCIEVAAPAGREASLSRSLAEAPVDASHLVRLRAAS